VSARLGISPFARLQRLCMAVLRGESPLAALFQTVGTQGVVLAANLLTGIVTARLLGPQGRGEYAAVSVWPQFLAMMAMAGLSSAIVYRMRTFPERAGAIAGSALLAGLTTATLATFAGVLLMPYWLARYSAEVVQFAQACLASVFVNTAHMVIKQCLSGVARYGRSNLAAVLPHALYPLALLLLIPLGAMTARGAVLALLLSGAVAVLVLLPMFLRNVHPRIDGVREQLPQMLHYSSRGWLGELVFTFGTYADRLVLIPLLPPPQLGLYAVAFSFSRLVQLVQPAIITVFFSQLTGRAPEEGLRLHDPALRLLLAVTVPGALLLCLVGEWLLAAVFGADFAAATVIFRVLVVEAVLGVLSQLTVQLFLSRNRPGFVSVLQGTTLALSVLLLLALVPAFGAVGAAAALAIAGAVRWLALLAAIRFVLGLSLPRLLLTYEDLQFMLRRLR
jgi:O-antigen/teichoic acid export membrane protein